MLTGLNGSCVDFLVMQEVCCAEVCRGSVMLSLSIKMDKYNLKNIFIKMGNKVVRLHPNYG